MDTLYTQKMMRFKGKTVLVTGSSRGIGRATLLEFAREGANVVINYLSSPKEHVATLEKEVRALGVDVLSVRCDVSEEKQVQDMLKKIMDHFGQLDIVVNNAGVVVDTPMLERTVTQWKRTMDVNLLGMFLVSKHSAQQMQRQTGGNGKIVNIASSNGTNSFSPDSVDYDSSKAGAIMLSRNLAKELAPGIQVNSVSPGWVATDMNKQLPKEFVQTETEKIYQKRFAKPTEIARVALFLASADADYITGSNLMVDGGYG